MIELKVPDELKLQAYFEMLCYDSETETGSAGCLEPGEQVVEVRIGALDVPLDWISPDMRADLDVWFSMQTEPDVRPRGIGGGFTMTGGELNFQAFKVTKFAAGVAVGSDEAYIAATATVIVSQYEASGGIFFGRTCSIAPLEMVDPDVAEVLGDPPFTGAYVYGEVWLPISETLLGIPASCFFRISAGVGAGAFYFVGRGDLRRENAARRQRRGTLPRLDQGHAHHDRSHERRLARVLRHGPPQGQGRCLPLLHQVRQDRQSQIRR